MTFTEMQNQVRILIGETSTMFFTDQEVKDQINRGLPVVASATEELITFRDYTTVASTQRYALPADYLKIKQLDYHESTDDIRRMILLSVPQFQAISEGAATQEGIPEWYKVEYGAVLTTNATQRPGDIWLYPIPDAVKTFRFRYYQTPTDLSAGTEISELPPNMHMAVCYKAAAHLALKNKDIPLYRELSALYREDILLAREYHRRPQRDRGFHVKDTMNYGIGTRSTHRNRRDLL